MKMSVMLQCFIYHGLYFIAMFLHMMECFLDRHASPYDEYEHLTNGWGYKHLFIMNCPWEVDLKQFAMMVIFLCPSVHL